VRVAHTCDVARELVAAVATGEEIVDVAEERDGLRIRAVVLGGSQELDLPLVDGNHVGGMIGLTGGGEVHPDIVGAAALHGGRPCFLDFAFPEQHVDERVSVPTVDVSTSGQLIMPDSGRNLAIGELRQLGDGARAPVIPVRRADRDARQEAVLVQLRPRDEALPGKVERSVMPAVSLIRIAKEGVEPLVRPVRERRDATFGPRDRLRFASCRAEKFGDLQEVVWEGEIVPLHGDERVDGAVPARERLHDARDGEAAGLAVASRPVGWDERSQLPPALLREPLVFR